jgi:hypothetical protein
MHPNPRVRAATPGSAACRPNDAFACFNPLTSPALLDEVESLLPEHLELLFALSETLSMFLSQALSTD